jgi:hypothetical protein
MATPQGAAPSPRPATLTPAIIILGADALLAARPATAGQLVNACYAAGYSAVIPSSWGDELVASGCLREIAARGQGSVVLCACPRVAERMRRIQSLMPQLLPLASPPVAAARYLRARAGQHGVHITYVGDCPGGADASIDRHATPGALLRSLAKRGIDVAAQPREVEERLLRDARRFYSLPGGAPAPNWLYVEKRGYTLIEPSGRDFLAEVAFRVAKRERRVVDLAPRLGCSCSGVVVGQPWTEARDTVAAVEPPRAVHEVLDHDVPVDLSAPLEPWTGSAVGGEPTVPIPLEALAGLYDAEAKASTLRSVPPPPIPWRRTSGPKSAEPTTPTRAPDSVHRLSPPAVNAAVDAPALETLQPAAESDTPTGEPEARNPAAADRPERGRPSREPATPVLRDWRPSGETEVAASDAGRSVASTGEPEAISQELTLSEAAERRSVNSAAVWPLRSERSGPHQSVVLAACLLLAVCATGAVSMLLAGRSPFSHRGSQSVTTQPATGRGHARAAMVPTDSATLADTASAGADSAAMDTGGAMPETPDLPRLPIGVAPDGRLSPSAEAMHAAPPLARNPAPVFTPGAAPIPRADQTAVERPPGGVPYSPVLNRPQTPASNARAARSADSVLAIQAEIARRRHRVDSLRVLLDSLAKRAKGDSVNNGSQGSTRR